MRPSAILLHTVGYNIASFAPQPTLFALACTFAQFGRHVTRDQSRLVLVPSPSQCTHKRGERHVCRRSRYVPDEFGCFLFLSHVGRHRQKYLSPVDTITTYGRPYK